MNHGAALGTYESRQMTNRNIGGSTYFSGVGEALNGGCILRGLLVASASEHVSVRGSTSRGRWSHFWQLTRSQP